LKSEKKDEAIIRDSKANSNSFTQFFGLRDTNDTGLDANTFFMGSLDFEVL
jgi:hypothetical protein